MMLDERFIEQLKSRQSSAFAVLVDHFEGPLYRFFLCGHRNHHLAEEQTAETFAQLVGTLPGMRGGIEQLRAYVYSTARHVQMRKSRRPKEPTEPIAAADGVSDPEPTPLKLADAREQARLVLNAISNLEEPLQNVLLLRFVENLSINEIGQAMGMPVGTVKSHISRGKAQLKLVIQHKEFAP